jgi:secreted PhoX family phosphatase
MLRKRLSFLASIGSGVCPTCEWRCGSACFRRSPNRSGNETFETVVARVVSRRSLLKSGAMAAVVLGTGCTVGRSAPAAPAAPPAPDPLAFTPIEPGLDDDVIVPQGYGYAVLLKWGQPILAGAPDFAFTAQTPEAQAGQFGYNCDFVTYLPQPDGQGVLWVNHEYTNPEIMFPDWNEAAPTRVQADVELAAHGGSIVVLTPAGGAGGGPQVVVGHALNRRITAETPMELTGPAAGADLLKTAEDPTGTRVRGMLNNCAGGTTPWGTVLTCEENFDQYFANVQAVTDARVRALHDRIDFDQGATERMWELHHGRFDLARTPTEPFRFGWVVEIDPTDPTWTPRKRTAMGRFKHEGATAKVAADGRVAFYMGDDTRFEYVYKFVTAGRYAEGDRAANLGLLDEGTLYAARFDGDAQGRGTGTWLPLVQGQSGLTPDRGFATQADVVINARGAADVVGATPMDRPEDVQAHPSNGKVYGVFTNNDERGTEANPGPDAANPRPKNVGGHIIELTEEGGDAAATRFGWEIFMLAGDPADPSTSFAGFPKDQVSPIASPDNLVFDNSGNMWLSTDGQPDAIGFNDGFYAVPVDGQDRGHVRMFARVPRGAEATGPAFTPDGTTFFAAVQHPGEGGSIAQPLSDWPDRAQPPRPSVVTIRRQQGDPRIGA